MVISMNSAIIIILGLCILVAESASGNHKVNRVSASGDAIKSEIQDQEKSSTKEAHLQETAEPGPIGYIYQLTSGKAIHPEGGSANPSDYTRLVVHSGSGESRLQFRYIPQPQFGHFGYIQHVSSGKHVHPEGGSSTAGDYTQLIFHSGAHNGTLFTFDEQNEQIIHIGGNHWHPYGGSTNPPDTTPVILHHGSHAATRFYLGDADGNKISAYPDPDLNGTWELVPYLYRVVFESDFIRTNFTMGQVLTQSQTNQHAWSVSAGFAKGLFSAGAEYSGFLEQTQNSTWSTQHLVETAIEMDFEEFLVAEFWQFVYTMEQYNEKLTFRSNIYGITNSVNVKPTLLQARSLI